jgi:hypothetical protein
LLYIPETILYTKEKCSCAVNKQLHTFNTRHNSNYQRYVHNLKYYNSKPSVAGCISYNKLPNNIKQICRCNQFKKEVKALLTKGSHYSIDYYLKEDISNIGD